MGRFWEVGERSESLVRGFMNGLGTHSCAEFQSLCREVQVGAMDVHLWYDIT